jgi:hypothetical protein
VRPYLQRTVREFIAEAPTSLLGELNRAYAADGFVNQYTSQNLAWDESIPLLQEQLSVLAGSNPKSGDWLLLMELPLYRLRRRIDAVVVTENSVVVLELKVGSSESRAEDRRQVEEYGLDLRDFHGESSGIPIIPVLWCTGASSTNGYFPPPTIGVAQVQTLGREDLAPFLQSVEEATAGLLRIGKERWPDGEYRPVPSIIEAATTLFAGHGVEEISKADADNLGVAAARIVELVEQARERGESALIFLTGVPGSGKTLAGLEVVHRAVEEGVEDRGDIVYLSGNTPLVTVLREALSRDEYRRRRAAGEPVRIKDVRLSVRARIQHIIDFLREYLQDGHPIRPHEHAIVFDEAQRAWDESYGRRKFGREASEPRLLFDIMGQHQDWCAMIALVGGGQEINTGENGIREWGDALRALDPANRGRWRIYAPPDALTGAESTAFLDLGDLPPEVEVTEEPALRLVVPLRTFRSPTISEWVARVLEGDAQGAKECPARRGTYPIRVTRSLEAARGWLLEMGRGQRRYGLVASSGARRLRAEGLGVTLNATEGVKIAQWYLNPPGDVRSSFALEVTANEYTTQGLELDYIGVCWGGDFLIRRGRWRCRRFSGNRWVQSRGEGPRFTRNSYRVLLTRAREGMVLWIPRGDPDDPTRQPKAYDETAAFLVECGAEPLGD